MHPQSTNIHTAVRDAYYHTFEPAGVLELINEYSGSDAKPSLL
jgi:hypothetical protein